MLLIIKNITNYFRNIVFLMIIALPDSICGHNQIDTICTFQEKAVHTKIMSYYDTYDYSRRFDWVNSNPGYSSFIMVSCRGGFNSSWNYGISAPDGKFSTMLSTDQTTWDGWTQAIFDFVSDTNDASVNSVFLQDSITSLLRSGRFVIALDVYYEDLDSIHDFSAVAAYTIPDSKTKNIGIKMQIRLQNAENYLINTESWSFLTKEAYITKPNTWQTLYFNQDDSIEISFNPLQEDGTKINRIFFDINYGYPYAVQSNYFIRNLRITETFDEAIQNNLLFSDDVLIYPNPVHNSFNYLCPFNPQSIEILDVNGRVICTSTNPHLNFVILNGIKPGIYFIKIINSENPIIVKKIIKID
jgi:hypothetical protein